MSASSTSSASRSSTSAPVDGVAAGPDRLDRAGHEVAQHVLGDLEAALELRDGLGRGLEHHDVVRAFAVAVDGIREPPAAPRGDLDDLPARGDDVACGAVDDRRGPLIRRIGPEDEHEFIAAHGRLYSFQWDLPRRRHAGAEPKGRREDSTGPAPTRPDARDGPGRRLARKDGRPTGCILLADNVPGSTDRPRNLGDHVAALDPPPRDRPRRGRGPHHRPDGARPRCDDRRRPRSSCSRRPPATAW